MEKKVKKKVSVPKTENEEAKVTSKVVEHTTPEKRLVRSSTDKMVSGVCAGLAEYFNIDPTIVRLIFVGLTVWGGSGILIYIVLAIVLPEAGSVNKPTQEVIKENAAQFESTVERVANNVESATKEKNTQLWIGIGVILLGLILLGGNSGIFDASEIIGMLIRTLWPLFIIALGLVILLRSQNGK